MSWDGICAFLYPDHRKRRSQSSRRLITLISVGWVPPDWPPSGAWLGLKCVLKISTIIFQLRPSHQSSPPILLLCWCPYAKLVRASWLIVSFGAPGLDRLVRHGLARAGRRPNGVSLPQPWAARASCPQTPWGMGACGGLGLLAHLPRRLSGLPDALS